MANSINQLSVEMETVACGICGSAESQYLFHARDYIYGNEGSWPVARCIGCGTVFMNPRILPKCIGPFYPKSYYTNTSDIVSEGGFKTKFKAAAQTRYYGYPLLPERKILRDIGVRIFGPIVSKMNGFQRNIHYVPNGKVLDVGCGNGYCLNIYKRLGWMTFGTEVGSDSARLASLDGHKIVVGELKDASYSNDYFEAVTFWDVLEHIPNPLETMSEAYRICAPEGRIYVYVPNFGSWYGRNFRDRWFMFTAPLHYYHYTAETLSYLLTKAGFGNIEIKYPLGGAGFVQTLNARFRHAFLIRLLINLWPVAKFLKFCDRFMPYGHLLAIATKSDLPRK